MLLSAREAAFEAAMQRAAADHERAVARLRAAVAAAAAAGARGGGRGRGAAGQERQQDPASITDAQLLRWQGSWDDVTLEASSGRSSPRAFGSSDTRQPGGAGSGSRVGAAAVGGAAAAGLAGSNTGATFVRVLSCYRGAVAPSAAEAAIAALEAVTGPAAAGSSGSSGSSGSAAALGLAGSSSSSGSSRHLSQLAPLSGLQPPAPRSRLVHSARCTVGEQLFLE
jgi:hypothetical protein